MNISVRIASLALSVSIPITVHAADISWTGNSSSNWSDSSNWAGGAAPANSTATDMALFNQASYANQPNYGATGIAGITVGGQPGDFPGALTFDGTQLTVGSGGITLNPGAVNNVTLNGSIRLDGNQTWTKLSNSGSWTINANITNNSSVEPLELTFNASLRTLSSRPVLLGSISDNGNGSGTVSLRKTGLGALGFEGSQSTFTGGIVHQAGTIYLNYSANSSLKLPGSGGLVLRGGGFFITGANSTARQESVASTNLEGGSASMALSATSTSMHLGNLTRSLGSSIVFSDTTTGNFLTNAVNTNGILGAWAIFNGLDWATNSANGANGTITAYADYTNIDALGSIISNNSTSNVRIFSSGSNGNITLGNSTTTINTLLQSNNATAATVDVQGKTLRTSGIMVATDAAALSIGTDPGSGTLTAKESGGELQLNAVANAILTINSVIADNENASRLTKSSTGTVILSANNTYTGPTAVNRGILQFAKIDSLYSGDTAKWTVDNINVSQEATLAFNVGGSGEFGASDIATLLAKLSTSNSAASGMREGSSLGFDTTNAPGGNFTLDQVISDTDGQYGGMRGLAKLGNGTLTLLANNTYTFTTSVLAGTLATGMAERISDSSAVSVSANATFQLGGNETVGSISGAGNFSIGGFTLTAGGDNARQTASGSISGEGGSLTKTGFETLILSGNNTYTGATTINGGTLQIGAGGTTGSISASSAITNNGTLAINRSDAITLSNTIAGTGNLTKSGAGTLLLSGSNTYTGTTTVIAGALNIQHANALGATSGNTTVASGAALQLQGGTTVGAEALSLNGTGVSATGALRNISGNNTYGGAITLVGATRINSDSDLLTLSGGIGGTQAFTIGGAGNTTVSGAIATSTGTLTKDGTGTLTLSGSNTYTGNTTVNAGTLQFAKTSSLYNGTTANWTASRLIVNSGSTLAFNIGNSTNGEFTQANINTLLSNLTGSNSSATSGMRSGAVFGFDTTNADGGSFTFNGVVANGNSNGNQTVGLAKLGSGTLILSGNNTYTGATTINAGTLSIATITNGGVVGTLGNSTSAASNLVLAGGALEYGGSSNGTTNRSFTLAQGTTSAIHITNATTSLTISGNSATTTGGLTKSGTGTLILSGNNTYTGATTINAGTLAISGGNAIANTGTVTLANAAGVAFNVNSSETIASLQGGGATGGNVTIASAQTLTVAEANVNTFSGSLQGSGNFTKSGSGSLTLNGASTNSGAVSVTGGTLLLSGASALSNGTSLLSAAANSTISLADGVGRTITLSTGNLSLSSASMVFELGTTNDRLTLTSGAVTLSGTNTISLANFGSFTAGNYTLISAASGLNTGGTWSLDSTGGPIGFTYSLTSNATTLMLSASTLANAAYWTGNSSADWAGNNFSDTNGGNSTLSGGDLSAASNLVFAATGAGNLATTISSDYTVNSLFIGTQGVSISGVGTLTINSTSATAIFVRATSGNTTISANLAGASAGLTKSNSGTLILSGSNTYNGTTIVSGGVLNIQHANALGSTANGTTVATGAALQLQGGITVGAEALSLSGTGVSADGALRNISGNNIYGGAITLATTTRINSDSGLLTLTGGISGAQDLVIGGAGNTTISGAISTSTGTLTKDGNGTLLLSGANTYNASIIINQGNLTATGGSAISDTGSVTLSNALGAILHVAQSETIGSLSGGGSVGGNIDMANTQTLTVNQSSSGTFAGAISGGGSLVKSGSQTLILTGDNTYTGGTTINAGTLQIGAGSTTGSLSSSSAVSNNGTLSFRSSNSLIFSNSISGNGSVISGGSTLTLSGNNSYSGGTTILDNTVILGADNAIGTGSLSFNATVGNSVLRLNGRNQTISGLSIVSAGFAGIVENNLAATTGVLTIDLASGVTVNGTTALNFRDNVGQLALVKTGSGTLNLSLFQSATNYSGGLTVNQGVLSYNAAQALGNSTAGGTITLGGGTLNYTGASASSVTISNNVTLTASTDSTFNNANGTVNVTGTISGSGNLIKTGAGTLSLNASNNYSGNTTISAGTLALGASDVISNSSNVTINGGTLNTTASGYTDTVNSLTISSGNLSGTGTITALNGYNLQGGAIGANLGTGTITVSSATTTLSGTAASTTVSINSGNLTLGAADRLSDSATVTVAGGVLNSGSFTDTVSVLNMSSGSIVGSGTLTATTYDLSGGTMGGTLGVGTANVTGSVSLTGTMSPTTLNVNTGGTLTLGSANRIGNSSAITIGGGTLDMSSHSDTVGILTITSGNLNGSGTLTASTYALQGGTIGANLGTGTINATSGTTALNGTASATTITLNGGNVTLGSAGRLASGANITLTSGALTLGGNEVVNRLTLSGGSLAGSGTLNATAGYDVQSGTISAALGGSAGLTKTGAGTVILSGANTYTGATTVSAGTLVFQNKATRTGGSLVTAAAAGTVGLGVGGGGVTDYSDTDVANLFNSTLSGFTLNSASGVAIDTTAGSFTQSTALTAARALTKLGNNTLTLTGINTYTGATTISAGTLSISSAAALGSTSGVNLTDTTALIYTGAAGNLTRDISVTGTTGSTGTIRNSGTGLLTLSGGLSKNGTTLTLAGGNNGITVSGVISGSNPNSDLVIDGGSVTLAAANTYNGPTSIINSGTLNANTAGALPTSTLTAVTINGNSTLALGASQSIASLSGTSGSTVNLNASTLTINGSSSTTYSGGISGTGNLVKNGSGTQTLAAANTYTGTTTINSGTLTANSANALGGTTTIDVNGGSLLVAAANAVNDAANINLDGGTLAVSGDFNETVGALTLSKDSIIDLNGFSGILRFSGLAWASGASNATLAIWNWSGTPQHGPPVNDYTNPSHVVFTSNANLTPENLAKISFYSGSGNGFIGNAFEQSFTPSGFATGTEIIAVPEPETVITAVVLLLGFGIYQFRLARRGEGLLSRLSFLRQAKRKPLEVIVPHDPNFKH